MDDKAKGLLEWAQELDEWAQVFEARRVEAQAKAEAVRSARRSAIEASNTN